MRPAMEESGLRRMFRCGIRIPCPIVNNGCL
ncbi:unknown protein [Azorhizobium caulinodans ORS 571]|uniref:Uncharacterized protein n=1 Tax=Azorhizobium caulinodans (strain ATCC 43989 / DSM 5975 / JCM 20966 / LMG 6465 / NBRC 14845 / NCIMB 13405 / ORS 571) TaxID=438753 RepID=A8HYM0_AZOC5|nr:unknown protein [Azorhizobium caulinodans ORS 571]